MSLHLDLWIYGFRRLFSFRYCEYISKKLIKKLIINNEIIKNRPGVIAQVYADIKKLTKSFEMEDPNIMI